MLSSVGFFLLHFFVNIFAAGRSNIKVILFFPFCLLVTIIFFLKKNYLRNNYRKIARLFWISVGALYSWSLFLFVYFFHSQKLLFSDSIILFANEEISTSVWYHNHLMKGAIGIVLRFFGVNSLENTDAGIAYIGLVNNWLFVVGFFIFCIAIISTFLYIFYIKEKINGTTPYQKILIASIYSISLFSLIKTGIDGGIFHPDAVISFISIISVNCLLSKPEFKQEWFSNNRVQVFILFLALVSIVFILGDFSYQIFTAYLYILLILVLMFLCFKIPGAKYIILLFCFFAFFASSEDRDILGYERMKIEKDAPAYVFSYKPPSGIFKITKQMPIGEGALYVVSPNEDTTVGELAENTGSIANMSPVAIPWQNCIPSNKAYILSMDIHTKNPLPETFFEKRPLPMQFQLKETSEENGWNNSKIYTYIDPCTPRLLNVLGETIKESIGNTPYFLRNFEYK